MQCPFCHANDDGVKDGRSSEDGHAYRRRRECNKCGRRYTTYERANLGAPKVRHRNGSIELFKSEIIETRIQRHCAKLPVMSGDIEEAASELLCILSGEPELTTAQIAIDVEMTLRSLHPVAALRFMLEWKNPEDAADMLEIIWAFADKAGIRIKQEERRK